MAARVLIFADARGIHTHGGANLARVYASQLRDGRIAPRASPSIVREHAAAVLMDAQRCLGLVSAQLAMSEAISRARSFGIGAVAVRNSTHCGSLSYYTHQGIEQGMIAFAFTNTGTEGIVRPPGGGLALLGTNVLAVGAPSDREAPFSLDMSTATVSTGQIRRAYRLGEEVRDGWLVDDAGHTVRDPRAFLEGRAHLQFLGGDLAHGGYKGYGLALLIDVLCGALAGSGVGADDERTGGGIGHLMIAINVEAYVEKAHFRARMDELLAAMLACPALDPAVPVSYPGHPEHERARDARRGIELDEGLLREFSALAHELDVRAPSVVDFMQKEVRSGA